jgi:hypothetical protein
MSRRVQDGPENPEAPWLVFEAGALSKNLDRAKVCPLLFGEIEPTDIKGPLVQFQAAKFGKDEMRRVLKMINTELGDAALASDVLESVFEMWWPQLDEGVSRQLEETAETGGDTRRSDRDMLVEILSLSRRNSRVDRNDNFDVYHPAFRDLLRGTLELCSSAREHLPEDEYAEVAGKILRPMEFFYRRRRRDGSRADSEIERLIEALMLMVDLAVKPVPLSDNGDDAKS